MTTASRMSSRGWAKAAPRTRSSPFCRAPDMPWLSYLSYFFGGAFLANAIPHFVSGMLGMPFQSPFAKPPGQGLSSSTVNALWGFFNLVVAYLLVWRVGDFDVRATGDVAVLG